MSAIHQSLESWARMIGQEITNEIDPDRREWVMGRMYYAAMRSAGRYFLNYLDNPRYKEGDLVLALATREFATAWMHDKLDTEASHAHIVGALIAIGDESTKPEKPDWITDEEWAQAQEDALHDESGKLVAPQLEGFLEGAYWDMPKIAPAEFDEDRVRQVVTAVVRACYKKVQADMVYAIRQLAKPNVAYWRDRWQARSWDAKRDVENVRAFCKQHGIELEQ